MNQYRTMMREALNNPVQAHVAEVAAVLFILLGVYFLFDSEDRKADIKILGWVAIALGVCWALFALYSGVRIMMGWKSSKKKK